jgi:hypothetical protein
MFLGFDMVYPCEICEEVHLVAIVVEGTSRTSTHRPLAVSNTIVDVGSYTVALL